MRRPDAPRTRREGADDAGTDQRKARTRVAVLEAGGALLAEHGVRGVTVEAVTARTGIAKTTIYRQWPSREHLVLAVIAETALELPRAHTDDPYRDIRTILVTMWKAMAEPGRRSGLASMIGSTAANPQLAALHAAFLDTRIDPLDDALARAVAAGVAAPDADISLLRELLAAPVLVRAFVRAEPVDRRHVERLMRQVLGPPPASPSTTPTPRHRH